MTFRMPSKPNHSMIFSLCGPCGAGHCLQPLYRRVKKVLITAGHFLHLDVAVDDILGVNLIFHRPACF